MKKILYILAVLVGGWVGNAHAALVSVDFSYKMNFVDPAFTAALGLGTGDLFSGTVAYDDTLYQPGQLVAADSLTMNFGNFPLTNANDNFGGALIGLGQTGQLTAMLFETTLTLGGAANGDYLLSFFGTDAVLTPVGNTFDYKATASVVPVPAALPLLAAGLAALGWVGRRRRDAVAATIA